MNSLELEKLAMTCSNQEYCTDCSARKGCICRRSFYCSKEQYNTLKQEAIDSSSLIALSIGHSVDSVATSMFLFEKRMDKKRKRELELHPLYSFD